QLLAGVEADDLEGAVGVDRPAEELVLVGAEAEQPGGGGGDGDGLAERDGDGAEQRRRDPDEEDADGDDGGDGADAADGDEPERQRVAGAAAPRVPGEGFGGLHGAPVTSWRAGSVSDRRQELGSLTLPARQQVRAYFFGSMPTDFRLFSRTAAVTGK